MNSLTMTTFAEESFMPQDNNVCSRIEPGAATIANSSRNDGDDNDNDDANLSTAEICLIIRENMQNIEKSLRCPLCLSCYQTATMIGACCHMYCQSCILQALQSSNKKECPTCKQVCTKRGLVPAPQFDALVDSFKHMLRDFGLAPAIFDPSVPVTQIVPNNNSNNNEDEDDDKQNGDEESNMIEEIEDDKDGDDTTGNHHHPDDDDEPDGLTKLSPASLRHRRRRRLALDWRHVHEHLQAARTFARHWGHAASTYLQREQAAVVSVNERVLVQAAVARQQKKQKHQLQKEQQQKQQQQQQLQNEQQQQQHKKSVHEQQYAISLSQQNREQAQEQQTADALLLADTDDEDNNGDDESLDRKPPATTTAATDTSTAVEFSQEFFSARSSVTQSENDCLDNVANAASVANHHQDGGGAAPPASESISGKSERPPTLRTESTIPLTSAAQFVSFAPSNNDNAVETRQQQNKPEIIVQQQDLIVQQQDIQPQNPNPCDSICTTHEALCQTRTRLSNNSTVISRNERLPTNVVNEHWVDGDSTKDTNLKREGPHSLVAAAARPLPAPPLENAKVRRLYQPLSERDDNIPSRAILRPHDYFSIGSIVDVESRTWPGVNKQGGVGRVTRVHFPDNKDGDDLPVLYDIAYILGGKEKRVESTFVSAHDKGLGREKEAGSLRIRFNNIPQSLLAQLEAEGFDTVGRPSLAMINNNHVKKEKDISRRPSQSKSPKKRLSDEPPDEAAHKSKKQRRSKTAIVSGVKNMLSRNRSSKQGAEPPELSDGAKCQHADELYKALFQEAQQKGVLHIVLSSLSKQEAENVVKLGSLIKKGPIRMKLCENLSNKISFCIVSTPPKPEPPDLVARSRTLKIMRAALAGIPLVAYSWIEKCLKDGKVLEPLASMYIRTLPTRVGDGHMNYGVAYLASLIRLGVSCKPLGSYFVYMCGKYTRQVENDMSILAKEAGATVLTQLSAVLARIRSEQKVVLLCNKTAEASLTHRLESEIKQHPKSVFVVTAQWLFDTVSSGKCQTARSYPPECKVAHMVWTVTSAAETMVQTSYFGTTAL